MPELVGRKLTHYIRSSWAYAVGDAPPWPWDNEIMAHYRSCGLDHELLKIQLTKQWPKVAALLPALSALEVSLNINLLAFRYASPWMWEASPEERELWHRRLEWNPRRQVRMTVLFADDYLQRVVTNHMRATFLLNTYLQSRAVSVDQLSEVFARKARNGGEDQDYFIYRAVDLLIIQGFMLPDSRIGQWLGSFRSLLDFRASKNKITVFTDVASSLLIGDMEKSQGHLNYQVISDSGMMQKSAILTSALVDFVVGGNNKVFPVIYDL